MSDNSLILLLIVSIIMFASPFFAKLTRLPIAPVEIILGSLAGYFHLIGHNQIFGLVAEVGFFYLMFLAGTHVDLKEFLSLDRKILKQGMFYLSLLYAQGVVLAYYLELGNVFMLIIPLLSVGLILTLFNEYGADKAWLNLSMIVGTLGEVLSISLLTFLSAYLEFGLSLKLGISLALLLGFLLFSILLFKLSNVLFWWYPKLKIILMPHYDKDEKDIRLSFALFFIMIALMLFLHLEIAFGAFIAGAFIATFFEHKVELPHKLSSFGFGFLVPVFFIHIGSTFDPRSLFVDGLFLNALIITFVMIFVRFTSSLVFIKRLGFKQCLLLALSHSMPLTLLIAVATLAFKVQTIDETLYRTFILVSLLQVIFSTVSIKFIHRLLHVSNLNTSSHK